MISLLQKVWQVFNRCDFDLISSSVAFWGVFSLFPAVAAFIAIFGLVADPAVVMPQLALMQDFIPADVYLLFQSQLDRLLGAGRTALGWTTGLSILVALWASRSGVSALLRGVNEIYAAPQRSTLRQTAMALAMTLALILVGVVALFTVVIAPVVIALVPVLSVWVWLLAALRWAVALFILLAALGLFFRYGPNMRRRDRPPLITPGAFVTVLCWFVASMGLSFYIANFGNYNQVYGSIGAVIALLLWLYVSAFFIMLGAAINYVLYVEGRIEDLR